MPEIRTFIPSNIEKNLIKSYNWCLSAIKNNDDFALLLDHDAHFTTYSWNQQMHDIILKYPECGVFVCVTNRCGGIRQLAGDCLGTPIDQENNDHEYHRLKGEIIQKKFYDQIEDYSQPIPHHLSGLAILVKKSICEKVPFRSWTPGKMALGVDSAFHQDLYDAGEKVYIMKGVYLYHYYRNNGKKGTCHLE